VSDQTLDSIGLQLDEASVSAGLNGVPATADSNGVMSECARAHCSRLVDWTRRYVIHHGRRNPAQLGSTEVTAFLTSLVRERGVSASTQNQARAALVFLYAHVQGDPVI
jgi:hypothetical protein